MKRINIIEIDMLIDEETGGYEYKLVLEKEFIKQFKINQDVLINDIENLIENLEEYAGGRN